MPVKEFNSKITARTRAAVQTPDLVHKYEEICGH